MRHGRLRYEGVDGSSLRHAMPFCAIQTDRPDRFANFPLLTWNILLLLPVLH